MKKIGVLLLFLCIVIGLKAQETVRLTGQVVNQSTHKGVNDVIIWLYSDGENGSRQVAYTFTDNNGQFVLDYPKASYTGFHLIAGRMGYATKKIPYAGERSLTITLAETPFEIQEVEVKGYSITTRGDTISFRASAFMNSRTYSLGDLVKRMPGLSVDKTGNISYLGERIQGLYIEGLDLLGNGYSLASHTLRAEDILAVDVMQHFQPVKSLRGLRASEGTTLNIRLKNKNMLRPSGDITAGIGTQHHNKTPLYEARGTALLVNSKVQYLTMAGTNNTAEPLTQHITTLWAAPRSIVSNILPDNKIPGADKRHTPETRTSGSTVNGLHKLGEDKTFKYNIGYSYDKQKKLHFSENELYTGNIPIHYRESTVSAYRTHMASTGLEYLDNSQKRYVLNRFKASFDHTEMQQDLIRNTSSFLQRGKTKQYTFEDNLHYKLRSEKNNLLELSGNFLFSNTPTSRLYVPDGDYAFEQEVWGRNFTAAFGTGYGMTLDKHHTLSGNVQMEANYGTLYTAGNRPLSEDMAKGGGINITTIPAIERAVGNWQYSLSFPVKFIWEEYDYLLPDNTPTEYRLRKILPGTRLNVNYRPNARLSLRLNGAVNTKQDHDLTRFLLLPIRTNYASLMQTHILSLPHSTSFSMGYSIEYKRPENGFFSSYVLSASRTKTNFLSSTTVNDKETNTTQIKTNTHRDMVASRIYFSQYISTISSTFFLEADGVFARTPILRQQIRNDMRNYFLKISPSCTCAPFSWANLDIKATYTRSIVQLPGMNSSGYTWHWNTSLSLSPMEKLSFTLDAESLITNDNGKRLPVMNFLDVSMQYTAKRYKIELIADNLWGAEQYFVVQNIASDIFRRTTTLRPREILLRVTFKY